jgi:hypothetical protein
MKQAMTATERKQKERALKAAKGLVYFGEWIPAHLANRVRAYIARIMKGEAR